MRNSQQINVLEVSTCKPRSDIFRGANQLFMVFGEALDRVCIFVQESSVFAFNICIICIRAVDELLGLWIWCKIGKIGAKGHLPNFWILWTSSFMPYSWQKTIYNLQMDINEQSSTNILIRIDSDPNKVFGQNLLVLGLVQVSKPQNGCEQRLCCLGLNIYCIPFLFHTR